MKQGANAHLAKQTNWQKTQCARRHREGMHT
jgi:hypothetical protein